jgi:hypothetical protein
LFQQPPEPEDCPICFLPLYQDLECNGSSRHWSCCGKTICNGCCVAVTKHRSGIRPICAFCRAPDPKTSY